MEINRKHQMNVNRMNRIVASLRYDVTEMLLHDRDSLFSTSRVSDLGLAIGIQILVRNERYSEIDKKDVTFYRLLL